MWSDRTKLLIGESGVEKLAKSHVAVIGLGGVGGYVVNLLARAGIGKITIIDFDRVDETNINRQIVADTTTVGQLKTEVMYNMIQKINPNCMVRVLAERVNASNLEKILGVECDYVVDAIDNVQDKVDLISYCKQNKIKIVSAMGAGNRYAMPNYEVVDIYKTHDDGLAKVLRKKFREQNIESLDVVSSSQRTLKIEADDGSGQNKVVGSISYHPAMCACVLASFVVNKLL